MKEYLYQVNEFNLILNEFLNSTADAFYAVDSNWRLTYINYRAEEYFRCKREELLGAILWGIVPEFEAETGYKEHLRAMQERIPISYEMFRPDLLVWIEVNIYPNSTGGLLVRSREITEKKYINEALRESQERFRALVEASSEVLYRLKPDLSEMRQLHSGGFLSGTERPNYSSFQEYIHPEDQIKAKAVINEAVRQKHIFEMEHRVLRADGSLGWMFSRAVPLIDTKGEIIEWFVVASDITKRKILEAEIKNQQDMMLLAEKKENEALKKAIEMKDEFFSLISHEFKTPLTVINSAIQAMRLICKNELTNKSNEFLNIILQNSNRQLKLVNNILDITRMNAGHMKINRTNIDIVLLTKSITESISVFAEQKGIKLSFYSTLKKKTTGMDEEKYERILLNLLSNAVKFTPKGKSITVRLYQKTVMGKCKICIDVRDQGIGIPQEKQQLIFERFGQADSSLSRQAEGTGIGLFIVKMFTEMLGGKISLESRDGKGSTFTVMLPVGKIKETPLGKMLYRISDSRLIQATAIEFSDVYR